MNRAFYFNFIDERLSVLAERIKRRGKLNILDLHLHSENFYRDFFNILFGWQLQNLNTFKPNAEAIDLIEQTNRIVVQVSATATREKVESALGKDLSEYTGYSFKFISISKDASTLRKETYRTPHDLIFNPKTDIFDISSILRVVTDLDIDRLQNVWDFIKKELSNEIESRKMETNLAAIINILAWEDLSRDMPGIEIEPFEIKKKITYNQLDAARYLIDDYKIHYMRVDRIYTEFDRQGVNKSQSVLDCIRREYVRHKKQFQDDDLFFKVIKLVTAIIRESANFKPIPADELDLCVGILVVDAFIRCKIFEKPVGDTDAAS